MDRILNGAFSILFHRVLIDSAPALIPQLERSVSIVQALVGARFSKIRRMFPVHAHETQDARPAARVRCPRASLRLRQEPRTLIDSGYNHS